MDGCMYVYIEVATLYTCEVGCGIWTVYLSIYLSVYLLSG